MTLASMTHHLTCPDCAAALQRNPAAAPGPAQCAIVLDDERDPAVWCPHQRTADSDWCEVHRDAILETRAAMDAEAAAAPDPDSPAELAQLIEAADRSIAKASVLLQGLDLRLRDRQAEGATATDLFASRMQREKLVADVARLYAGKAEAEAKLAAMNCPGGPVPGSPGDPG